MVDHQHSHILDLIWPLFRSPLHCNFSWKVFLELHIGLKANYNCIFLFLNPPRCQCVFQCWGCLVTEKRFYSTVTSRTSCWRKGNQSSRSFTVLPLTSWRSVPLAWLIWYIKARGSHSHTQTCLSFVCFFSLRLEECVSRNRIHHICVEGKFIWIRETT